MGKVSFQVTTRTGKVGQKVDPIVQVDGTGRPGQIADKRMAAVLGELVNAAAQAADHGMVTEVAVLVYPAGIVHQG